MVGASGLASLFTIWVETGHFTRSALSQACDIYTELTQSNLPATQSIPRALTQNFTTDLGVREFLQIGVQRHHNLLPLEHISQGGGVITSISISYLFPFVISFEIVSHGGCDIRFVNLMPSRITREESQGGVV